MVKHLTRARKPKGKGKKMQTRKRVGTKKHHKKHAKKHGKSKTYRKRGGFFGSKKQTNNASTNNNGNPNPARELKNELMGLEGIGYRTKTAMMTMFKIEGDQLIGKSSGFKYSTVPKSEAYFQVAKMITESSLLPNADAEKFEKKANELKQQEEEAAKAAMSRMNKAKALVSSGVNKAKKMGSEGMSRLRSLSPFGNSRRNASNSNKE